jgi:hypothetical protein
LTTAPEEGYIFLILAFYLSLTSFVGQATPSSDTMARNSILGASQRGRNLIPGACSFTPHAQYRSRQTGHIAYVKGTTGPQQKRSPPAALVSASSICLHNCSYLHPASECDCCVSCFGTRRVLCTIGHEFLPRWLKFYPFLPYPGID